MKSFAVAGGFALLLLTGCFSIRETPRPELSMKVLPMDRNVRVQLAGFDASFTSYVPSYGYATVMGTGGFPDCHGGYRNGYGITTVTTTEFVPQVTSTAAYRDRATDALERCGCILQSNDPQYRVEVRFEGPYNESADIWADVCWSVLTLFTADYGAQNWAAKLKIHDSKSGRLVFARDLSQRYETLTWGLLPILSPACNEKTSDKVMKDWCLTALTDQAVAEAISFFAR